MSTTRAQVSAYNEIKELVLDASARGRGRLDSDKWQERDDQELLAILAGIWERYFG